MHEADVANLILNAEIDNIVTEFHFGSKGVQNGPKRRKHIRAQMDLRIGTASVHLCSDYPNLTLMKRVVALAHVPFDRFTDIHTDIRCAAALKVEEIRAAFNDSMIRSSVPVNQMIQARKDEARKKEMERRKAMDLQILKAQMVGHMKAWSMTKDEVIEMWMEAVVTDVIES